MKHLSYICLFLALALATLCLFLCNRLLEEKNECARLSQRVDMLSDKQLQYIESIRYPLDNDLELQPLGGQKADLDTLTRHARLVLYIDNRHCVSCWQEEIQKMRAFCDTIPFSEPPIIIANNFGTRELKLIQKEIRYRIYSIGYMPYFLPSLTKFNVPFYCILDRDGSICCPYFPSNEDMGAYPARYFKYAQQVCMASGDTAGTDGEGLIVLDDELDLCDVPARKKISGRFRIKNQGKTPCHLLNCYPSCSCIVVDSFSHVISPGGIGYVSFTTVQKAKGPFHHSINVQTDHASRPVPLNFRGNCK